MQSPQYNPIVQPGHIPGLSSPPPLAMPSIPRFHGDMDNADVGDLMALLQSQAESRQAIAPPVTIPVDVLLLLLQQRQRQDPWAIGLLVGGVTVLFCASMVALFLSPSQRLSNQNERLIEQNAALSKRSADLAKDAINKPRCSFVLYCP